MVKLSEASASRDLSGANDGGGGLKAFLLGGEIRGPGNLEQITSLESLGQNEIADFDRSGLGGIRDIVLGQGRITTQNVADVTGEAQGRASNAFAVSEGILERGQRGQNVSARQLRSQQKRLNLRRALSQVDASNRAVEGLRQRQDVARSGAGDIRDVLFGQALEAKGGAAQAEGERETLFQQEQAQAAADRAAGIGQVAGIVGTAIAGSSRTFKDEIGDVSILDKLTSVPVKKWRYKGEQEIHIGPYAEDFNEAFGLSGGKFIYFIDLLGVLVGAVKELHDKVDELALAGGGGG